MKGSLYSCLLIACLPSGIKTLIWHLETIYMVDWTNVKFTETVSLRWVTKDKWSRCLVGSWAMCEQRMIEGGRVWQVVKTGSTQRWYKLMWPTKNPWAVKDKWSQCWGWLHAGQRTPELWKTSGANVGVGSMQDKVSNEPLSCERASPVRMLSWNED